MMHRAQNEPPESNGTEQDHPDACGLPPNDRDEVARAASVVSGATMLSRLLGAARDIIMASFLGTGMISDAFIAAFRIPNLLRRLFGEGSLSIAFIPVFTDTLYLQGRAEADRVAAGAMRLTALILALVTVFGLATAPWLVRFLAPGFFDNHGQFALTVDMTRIMMPYVFFIGMVALCMGILNVLGHFAAPALAPVFLNLAMIGAIGSGSLWTRDQSSLVLWLAVGVVAGGALQLALQLPFLVKHGFRIRADLPWWHPSFQRIAWMLGPVLFGTAVYQINSLTVTLLASLLPQGSISYLYYADRLVQFPLGIFGIATATAALPVLSRQAAARQFDAMRQTFSDSLKLVIFITLPAAVGLIVLREPIVALLFERGAFDEHSTRLTASALLYYCVGLWAFAAIRVVLNVFYALKDTRTPVRVAVLSIAANLLLGLTLMGHMQHDGLALALSLASIFNLGLLAFELHRRLGALGWRGILKSVFKSAVCAVVMGGCVQALAYWLLPSAGGRGIALLPAVAICGSAGIAIFVLAAASMRLDEWNMVVDMVRKKRRGGRMTPAPGLESNRHV